MPLSQGIVYSLIKLILYLYGSVFYIIHVIVDSTLQVVCTNILQLACFKIHLATRVKTHNWLQKLAHTEQYDRKDTIKPAYTCKPPGYKPPSL